MKKAIVYAVAALLTLTAVSAPGKIKLKAPDKKSMNELRIADKFYAESYYYTAAEYYKDVVRQDSANRYANFWLAMSLLQARDYENAEIFFRQFYDIKKGEKTNVKRWDLENQVVFNKGEYYFGEVLHRNGKYDEAMEHLSKFVRSYTPDPKDKTDNLKKIAENEIAGCEYSKNAPKAKVKLYNAGPNVNRSYNEAAPFGIGENELYYTGTKGDTKASDTLLFVNGPKPKPIYQMMHVTKNGKEWGKPKAIDNKDINTPGFNVGNGTFNAGMTRFYFTKCLEMEDDRSLCNIFVADFNHGAFSNVKRLPDPVNSKEKYTCTQPTVRTADDGTEMIYFSSDAPGGAGGMDIWYTTRLQNGDFKEAGPIKGAINTAGDEVTPYWDDSTHTLYFSSTGHPGLGGYDVFRSSENVDLSWGPVSNIGVPVNSGADDLYYSRSNDQTYGYMVSNREGSVPLNGIKTASDDIFYWSNYKYAVEGTAFKEGDGGGELLGATFKLYRKLDDGTKVLVAVDSNTARQQAANAGKAQGSYFFKLNPETDYTVEVDREGFQPKYESISTKGLPDEDTLNTNLMLRKNMAVAKGQVIEEGKGIGVIDANIELREVYPNGLEKTVYYAKSDPYYTFDVELGKRYKLITRKEAYFTNTTELNMPAPGSPGSDTVRKDINLTKLELNKAYTLANVLYEFGKATLTETSKQVLDNLYQIMVENPSFIIELSSHTDAIGSDEGNMKLSQDRAQSCVNYLLGKGISKDRLVAKGYGKTRPKVPNTTPEGKDDPAGRAINRRTEFQIIGVKKEN